MFVPLLLIRCVLASYLSRIENFFSEKTESLLWHQYYTLACACLWRQPDIVDFAEEKNCVKINEISVLRYLNLKVKERRRIHAFTTRNHLMTFFLDACNSSKSFRKIYWIRLIFIGYRLNWFESRWRLLFSQFYATRHSLSDWNERQRQKNKQNKLTGFLKCVNLF